MKTESTKNPIEAEKEYLAKKREGIRDYFQTRMWNMSWQAREKFDQPGYRVEITGSRIQDNDGNIAEKAGINWSACGTQDTATARKFAEALNEAATMVDEYNAEREFILTRLHAEEQSLADKAREAENQEWGDNPEDR